MPLNQFTPRRLSTIGAAAAVTVSTLAARPSARTDGVDESTRTTDGQGDAAHEPQPGPEAEAPSIPESPGPSAPRASGGTASEPHGPAQETALEMVLDKGWRAVEFHNRLGPL